MGTFSCSRCGTTLTGSSSDSSGLCERCALELRPTLEEATPDPSGLAAPSGFNLDDSVDAARGAAAGALTPGHTLGKYTIEAELGRGGMAVVYRATQAGLDRQVALKVLSEGPTTSPERVERFFREARAAAKLNHPNIVPVHEVGDEAGVRFLAMEWVDGLTMDEAIRREQLDWRRAAEVVRDCARALHYAHSQGVVHRDVKPGNIMLEASGTPRVTDFGLARVEGGGALTADGTAIGTPAYMSPEQAAGDQSAIGPPTDVYALGAVLYESLTGRPPATGESVLEILHAVQSVEPPPVRKLAPGVPADLATVTEKAIAKDLNDRYADAEALAEELDRVLTGDSILARPPGPLQRGLRAAKRHPLLMAASAVAVVALIVGFGIWVQLQKTRSGLEEANRETEAAMDAAAQARIAKETRDRELREARPAFERAESKLTVARNARRNGDDARARDALAQARPLIDSALGTAPHFAEAWLLSARLRVLAGDHAESLADYGRAIEHNPSLSEAYYERVRLQFDRHFTVHVAAGLQDHQAGEAIAGDLAQLKALEARPAQAHAAEAMARLLQADFAGAEAAVQRSLDEDPYFADAFALRAGVRMGQGYYAIINGDMKTAGQRFREALKDFEAAVRNGADPDQILAGRAQVQAEMGRYPQAIADGQRFVELDPADADRWFLQARLLKIAGKRDAAADALAKARELADDTPEHHLQAAAVLLADKMRPSRRQHYQEMYADLVEAKRELDWVVQHAPNHPVARFYRAVVNSAGGDFASSAADLRVFLNEVPERSNYRAKAQSMLALIDRQLEGQARVERVVEQQVAQQKQLLAAQERSQQAYKLMTEGKIAEAEVIYRKLIDEVTAIEQSGAMVEKAGAVRGRGGTIRVGDLEIEIDESGLSRVVAGRARRAGERPGATPEAPREDRDKEPGKPAPEPAADQEAKSKRKAEELADKLRSRQRNVLREVEEALEEELAKLPAEARREIERSRRRMQQRNRTTWGREMASQVKQVAHYNVACALALRHAKQADAKLADEAIAHLEQAVKAGFSEFRHMAGDRDFASLRTDPRFKQVLDSCALQAKREAEAEAAARKARRAAFKVKQAAHKSSQKTTKKTTKKSGGR
ncbi:MAG: serine/threonine-protein kinase [Planctomycetota bacterium]|jgi:tetratricopeptide (TPR) repeat protein